jgi:hypothetical protein
VRRSSAVSRASNQNYTLLLYTAGIVALVRALIVLPIKNLR